MTEKEVRLICEILEIIANERIKADSPRVKLSLINVENLIKEKYKL